MGAIILNVQENLNKTAGSNIWGSNFEDALLHLRN
jgi:hypothetical protein